MEEYNLTKEKLSVPTDFTTSSMSRNIQKDLIPPSHFTSSVRSTGILRAPQQQESTPISWLSTTLMPATPVDPSPPNPWVALTQARREILELKKENRRIMTLQGDSIRGRNPTGHSTDSGPRSKEKRDLWYRCETEWRLDVERHKAEAERLKGQVEALRETAERHREEIRDRDGSLNRRRHEMDLMRDELCKAKTELKQITVELKQNKEEKERIVFQFERLEKESGEEIARLKNEVEESREEARSNMLKAEVIKLQAGEEAEKQNLRLAELFEESKKKQEMELQQMTATYNAELATARQTNSEVQEKLGSLTSEVLRLQSSLIEVSTERDGLKQHLSQTGQAFETQSKTLQSLRNYIGQLSPGSGEKEKEEREKLTETIEKLKKEKEALQMTKELLTVRYNSVNEILALQEKNIIKKTLSDPLLKTGSEGLQVLQLWRDKVFMLCVQLRTKDIELRAEKDKYLIMVRSMEQQVKQEQYGASVLQHSLDDKIAELDLERMANTTLKQDWALALKENSQQKSWNQKSEAESRNMSDAVQKFCLAFEAKVAEVDRAQAQLPVFTQRVSFALRRVETIQGLIMRRVALQKLQQASKVAEQSVDSIKNLQTELSLVCEERNRLTQELKRTPELIEKALADLREQFDSKLRQQQQELEQSRLEVCEAVCSREEAQQRLQQAQTQLEESKVNLEQLHSELLSHREHSEQALKEKASETEDRCADRLREMEGQVNTSRREHTKAVMALRQLERQVERDRNRTRATQDMEREHTKGEIQDLQKRLKETEKDKNLLLATVHERGLINEYRRARTPVLQNSVALGVKQNKPSERSHGADVTAQPPARDTLLSVLEDLQTLSAAVVNSSEDSTEEEGQGDGV